MKQPKIIEELNLTKTPIMKIDPKLNKYGGHNVKKEDVIFKKKVEEANQVLSSTQLPFIP